MNTQQERIHQHLEDRIRERRERLEVDCRMALLFQDPDYYNRLCIVMAIDRPESEAVASLLHEPTEAITIGDRLIQWALFE